MKSNLSAATNSSAVSKGALNARTHEEQDKATSSNVDAHWLEAQTSGFIDWINFTFSSHLTLNEETEEVVGMVINDDDFLHGTYHIFDVPYIAKLPPAMIAEIETEGIAIRSDQNIFVDVGLQKNLLSILFSYELPWLRLGIEAVLHPEGEALSEDDMYLLSDQIYSCVSNPQRQMNFIKSIIHERFIKDPKILQKYSKQKPLNFQLEAQMHAQMRRHFIKKIFTMVRFLDIARMKQALKLPRLFKADSSIKSSQEVLVSICKELLRSEGDYLHHLSTLGYKVAFKQSYVDEFDYQVKNLSVDMRDGVRLAKLVSLVADDEFLCDHLRVPAVSRLQKVHNVMISLESLHSSGESIFADLDDGLANDSIVSARSALTTQSGKVGEDRMQAEARRITEGNTEAILILLWRIMFAFNLRDMVSESVLLREVGRVARGAIIRGDPREEQSADTNNDASDAERKIAPYLMYWCNAVMKLYGIEIDDFTTSLADGSVLCLLVHFYHPELLPLKSIHQSYKLQSLDDNKITDLQKRNFVTLRRACKAIGGIPVLSKEYSVQDPPDSHSMTFFLAYLFSRLMACEQTKAAIRIQRTFKQRYASVLAKFRKEKPKKKQSTRFGRTNFLVTISASKHHAARVIQTMFLRFMQKRRLAQLHSLQAEVEAHPEELEDVNSSLCKLSFTDDENTLEESKAPTSDTPADLNIDANENQVPVTDNFLLGLSSEEPDPPVPTSVRKVLGERDLNACDSSFTRPTPFKTATKENIDFFSPDKVASNLSFIEKRRRTRSLLSSPLFDKENSFAVQTPLVVASVDTSEIEDRYRREMECKVKQTAAEVEETLRSQFMTESKAADDLLKAEREARQSAEMMMKLEAERRLALEQKLQQLENERFEAELRVEKEKAEIRLRQQREADARLKISRQLLLLVYKRRLAKKKHAVIRLQAAARSYIVRKQFRSTLRGICKIQGVIKHWLSSRRNSQQHSAAIVIQAASRRLLAKKLVLSMKRAAVLLQSHIRAHLAQAKFRLIRQACIRVQSVFRGYLQRSAQKRTLQAIRMVQGSVRVYLARKELAARKRGLATLQRFLFQLITAKRCDAASRAQQQARLQKRVRILRAAAVIAGACRTWVLRKKIAHAAARIVRWYKAYTPLLKARKLRKGVLRLQVGAT